MSKLEVLLKRIHALPQPPPIFEPTEPSDKLKVLLNRIDTRRWLADEIPRVREFIKSLRHEIRAAEHIVGCKECLIVAQLDVERYLGTKSVWWLNMMNLDEPLEWEDPTSEEEIPYLSMLRDMPKARDYKIGCYGHSSDDTIRFVKDRGAWAKKTAVVQMTKAKEYYVLLKHWKFTPETQAKAEALLEWLMQSSNLSGPPDIDEYTE